jgi:hypothetical protein
MFFSLNFDKQEEKEKVAEEETKSSEHTYK